MNSWSLEPEGYWEQPWPSLALPIGSSMYRSLPFADEEAEAQKWGLALEHTA